MGHYQLLGFPMQQQPMTVDAFSKLLGEISPARIIELGTGMGGLTVFFGLYGYRWGCQVVTYDVAFPEEKTVDLLCRFGVSVMEGDIFGEYLSHIGSLVMQPGVTLLVCDDGNKVKEFNTFARNMKVGDIIMAHDYWHERRLINVECEDNFIHSSCDVEWDEVKGSCDRYSLEPFMQENFTPLLWLCRRRVQ